MRWARRLPLALAFGLGLLLVPAAGASSDSNTVTIVLDETVAPGDGSTATPPRDVGTDEPIGTTDAVAVFPPASVPGTESVTVGEVVTVLPPATIVVDESVTSGDTPNIVPPPHVPAAETAHVSDDVSVSTSLIANVVTFGPTPTGLTVGGTDKAVSATATSGLPVTYSSKTAGFCAVDASTGALTLLAAGTCTIAADQAGNDTWDVASQVTQTVTIGQASSTVTVTCTAGAPFTYTGSAQTPCTAQATGPGMSPVDVTASLVYANNIGPGAATATATWDGDDNHTGSTGSGGFTIGQAASIVAVTCTTGAPYTYTGLAQAPCTAQATGVGMIAVDVTASLVYANNTNAGAATAKASWGGDANHTGSTGSGGFTIAPAPTSVLYTGDQNVTIPNAFKLAAQRTGPAACPISYALDPNPLTGVAGPYALGSGGTVPTTGWHEGAYILIVTVGGNGNCLVSTDQAALAVSSPGGTALGGGWYSLTGAGRVNFAFTVRQVPNKTPPQYTGMLSLVNNGTWRLTGSLSTYTKLGATGTAAGTGTLSWWNPSLNGRRGGWVLAASKATYTISFTGSTAKSAGSFGVKISYTPIPPQPGSLPNSSLTVLQGGFIKLN